MFKLLERMMAFLPHERFQSPAQLHEAVRRTLNELEGHATDVIAPSGPRTVFVVEGVEKLQDALREKLKALNYRVLISHDPEAPSNVTAINHFTRSLLTAARRAKKA